jgi:small subunit ribosomal protein S19
MRAKWKGPFIKQKFYLKKNKIIIFRNIEVVPAFVGFWFFVHNGKTFVSIKINEKMIGHKFGEFCFTKFKPYGSKD